MRTIPIFLPRGGGSGSPVVLLAFVPWLVSMLFMTLLFRILLYGNKRGWGWAKWLIVEWRWSAVYLVFVFVLHYAIGMCSGLGVFFSLLFWILYPAMDYLISDLFMHNFCLDSGVRNISWRGATIRSAILIPLFIILSFL